MDDTRQAWQVTELRSHIELGIVLSKAFGPSALLEGQEVGGRLLSELASVHPSTACGDRADKALEEVAS